MYSVLKRLTMALLRVPPEPSEPLGSTGSRRQFRAAPGFYRYRLALWAVQQGVTLLGAVAVVVALHTALGRGALAEGGVAGAWLQGLLLVGELFAVASFLVQLPLSYAAVRLDYELRWYKLTDTSLRVREGVWKVREMTMTLANIQNIDIQQGPIQRLLGIADLRVQSAGGGGGSEAAGHSHSGLGSDLHVAWFRGVGSAAEIRDLMLARLRAYRDAGLGDLEDALAASPRPASGPVEPELQAVLAELRVAAGRLRAAAESL